MTNSKPASQNGRRKILLLLSLGAFALLVFAGFRLLLTAFEVGDVYPEYSSLAVELEGTEVLYEALEAQPGLQVARSYTSFGALRGVDDATVLAPGFEPRAWETMTDREAQNMRGLVEQGARIVVAFDATPLPAFVSRILEKVEKAKESKSPDKKGGDKPKDEKANEKKPSPAEKLFAIKVDRLTAKDQAGERWVAGATRAVKVDEAVEEIPERLEWSRGIQLTTRDASWKVICKDAEGPAVVERELGRGSLVVLTDSYLLTNRAMWKSRRPDFLLWLLGGRKRVLFQEAHLGVSDDPGVAWLARKYRLHGLFAALIALLALFAWKESASTPTAPDPGPAMPPPGESHAGLVALLARCVPHGQVLDACITEWAKTESHDPRAVETLRGIIKAAESATALSMPAPRQPGNIMTRTLARVKLFARKKLTHRRDPVHAYNEVVRHCKVTTR